MFKNMHQFNDTPSPDSLEESYVSSFGWIAYFQFSPNINQGN
jgi:hypothetical protein